MGGMTVFSDGVEEKQNYKRRRRSESQDKRLEGIHAPLVAATPKKR